MAEPNLLDLIHLENTDADGARDTVRVQLRPDLPTIHNYLRADVLVSASFVDARLDLYLSPDDLTAWQHELSALAPGATALIGGDRGLNLTIHLNDDEATTIEINDPDRLYTILWIRPHDDWINDHRARIERARRAWPAEGV
ncbi:DUF5959 family protein [Kitasatospora sp. NBC_01302]|uniref:DUF5959 family protein n=1 Tax=Kitasatospora sp. NBC_01302 TaxID=2903575 RepID=UPI002E0E0F5C|nr:DUF5959 family protein [Kitasatospora sp. NBC_01302]